MAHAHQAANHLRRRFESYLDVDLAARHGADRLVGRPGGAANPFGDGTIQRRWETASLDDLAEGMGRMAFTLRFTLSHPDLHTTIVGTTSPDHLAQNVEAARSGPLPDDIYEEAKRRLAAAGSRPE